MKVVELNFLFQEPRIGKLEHGNIFTSGVTFGFLFYFGELSIVIKTISLKILYPYKKCNPSLSFCVSMYIDTHLVKKNMI